MGEIVVGDRVVVVCEQINHSLHCFACKVYSAELAGLKDHFCKLDEIPDPILQHWKVGTVEMFDSDIFATILGFWSYKVDEAGHFLFVQAAVGEVEINISLIFGVYYLSL